VAHRERSEYEREKPSARESEEKRGFPGAQMMMIFLGCSLLMTLGRGGMTGTLIFASSIVEVRQLQVEEQSACLHSTIGARRT
jgi:hypothetical protein